MTVKDKVGRPRYVAFAITAGAPVHRAALAGALPAYAKLTRFDGEFGIVRVGHRDRDAILAVLKGTTRLGKNEVRIQTLTTSGTIRGAAQALPEASSASRRTPPPRRD